MEITEASNPNLDIYDINGRTERFPANFVTKAELESAVVEIQNTLGKMRELDEVVAEKWPAFSSKEYKESRLSLLQRRSREQTRKQWRKENDFSYRLEVSPGSIKIGRKLINQGSEKTRDKSPNYKPKTVIKEWSPKSRANMVARFCSLDYAPLFTDELRAIALVTLTYPESWEIVAPTGQHAKRHLFALKKRYQRAFGTPLYALYKVEFQARGAVHFHLLCAPPNNPAFRKWLAETWADVVHHPNLEERKKHEQSGTHISYDQKYGDFDSRSISVYFSKHSSPNMGAKEYQNKPPQLWIDSGKIGRFWGYFGLKPLVRKIPITFREAVVFSRTLRRLSKRGRPGQPKPMRRKVVYGFIYRRKTTERTGLLRRRVVKVPVQRFPSVLGFLSVANGARMALHLSRVLTLERTGRC